MYIMGDMNIDLLKYHSHQQTERYLDMIYSLDLLPVITKPTRITNHTATLIEHIYTNNVNRLTSGIVTVKRDHSLLSQLISRTIYQSFLWLTHLSKSKIDKIRILEPVYMKVGDPT